MSTNTQSTQRYHKAWAQMDRSDRRRILRAVNRVQALDSPAEAALAVTFAQRQRRMWTRWAWVLPIVGGLITLPVGWEAALANVAFGGIVIGIFSVVFSRRAARAERLNQEVVEAARKSRRSGSPKKRSRGKKVPRSKRKKR